MHNGRIECNGSRLLSSGQRVGNTNWLYCWLQLCIPAGTLEIDVSVVPVDHKWYIHFCIQSFNGNAAIRAAKTGR